MTAVSVLAAALLAASALAAPAAAKETPSGAARIVLAQAKAEDGKPARRRASTGEKREPTARQLATRERQRKCAAEWRETKSAGKVAEGMRWPQFWSKCNARLKGANV